MGGIGMLAVGILGFPFIGYLQESTATKELNAKNPALYQSVTAQKSWVLSPVLGDYTAIDPLKESAVQDASLKETINQAKTVSQFSALGKMAMFPGFMLCGYLCLIVYFRSKGGYKAVNIEGPQAQSAVSAEAKPAI